MADQADISVDDLRRRARRRLVGAIVLALVAAVVVPMLLESDPKPLGESVAVKIPPVDDGKFVNRLSDGAPKTDAPTSAPAPAKDARKDAGAADATRKSVTEAERAVVTPPGKAPKYDTQVDKAPASATGAAAAPAGEVIAAAPAKDAPAASAKDAAAAPAKDAPASAAKDAAPAAAPKEGAKAGTAAVPAADPASAPQSTAGGAPKDGYSVQLAAYSDDKGANALANRLKRAGYPAYTEPLTTSRGTLYRVRVGPYPTRDAANGVRDKLKTEGQNGIVAPSR